MSKLLDQNCKQPDIETTCRRCHGIGRIITWISGKDSKWHVNGWGETCPLCKGEGTIKERI